MSLSQLVISMSLRSQIATSNKRGGTRYLPFAFTELGVAMLSSILTSDVAIQVNLNIMRAFVFMRNMLHARTEMENLRLELSRQRQYMFTRNGVGMLSSVLRSETAVGVNIRIMRAFTAIPQMVNQQTQVIQRIFSIEQRQQETDEKIELILDKIEEISPKQVTEQIFQTGCVWDAWAYVSELVRSAKERIELIDNFVDDRVLSLFLPPYIHASQRIS